MTIDIELLPCPFCGGAATASEDGRHAICLSCKTTPWIFVENWNRRASIPPSTGDGGDSARLDWLEQRGNERGGLLLHAGNEESSGRCGLGLKNTGRTLRQAVDSARGVKAAPQAAPVMKEKT